MKICVPKDPKKLCLTGVPPISAQAANGGRRTGPTFCRVFTYISARPRDRFSDVGANSATWQDEVGEEDYNDDDGMLHTHTLETV